MIHSFAFMCDTQSSSKIITSLCFKYVIEPPPFALEQCRLSFTDGHHEKNLKIIHLFTLDLACLQDRS